MAAKNSFCEETRPPLKERTTANVYIHLLLLFNIIIKQSSEVQIPYIVYDPGRFQEGIFS